MNARINTVLSVFDIQKRHESSLILSSLRGTPFSVPRYSHALNLEELIAHCWNAELKRSRSLEPTHCTLRIPPVVLGEGDEALSVINAVVSVRANGSVHVLGSGSIRGILTIAMVVRQLLTDVIRGKPSMTTESTEAMKRRKKEETLLMDFVHHPTGMGTSTALKKSIDCGPTEGRSAAIMEADDLFSSPRIVFARAVVHPVKPELQRLREQEALQPRTSCEPEEEVHRASAEQCEDNEETKEKNESYNKLQRSHPTTSRWKRQRRMEETNIPLNQYADRGITRSISQFPDGIVRLNVVGDEAFEWWCAWVGASGKSAEEETTVVLSGVRSHHANTSYVLKHLNRLRAHVVDSRARRLPRRAGVQFHLRWRPQALPVETKSVDPTGLPPVSLAGTESVVFFDGLDSFKLTSEGSDTTERKPGSDINRTLSLSSTCLTDSMKNSWTGPENCRTIEEGPPDANLLYEVDCIMFSSGCGHVVCSSASVMHDVIQIVLLPLLVIQAEF